MIPVTQYNGEQVAVLGMGRSGLTAARALKAGGATPVCWDDGPGLATAEEEGFLIANLHDEQVWKEHDFEALILSPGIPHLYPDPHPVVRLAWRHGVLVDNDVSLFFNALDELGFEDENGIDVLTKEEPKTVCITGSNGKSTTTALIAHILEQAGRPVQMGGNIGRGVLDLDPPRKNEIYVLELSSYQTELASFLSPHIAVFLNFSPDHYDRHGGRGGYFAAKARLFEEGTPYEVVIGVGEDEGRYLANHLMEVQDVVALAKDRTEATGFDHSLFVEGDALVDHLEDNFDNEAETTFNLPANPVLKGVHNRQNMAAALAVCRLLGLDEHEITSGLANFKGLPHRMEIVGQLGGITFINDSKATNVESATKSLGAFDNIYWIAGGVAKEGGFKGLDQFLPRITKACLIGQDADQIAAALGDTSFENAGRLEKALDIALEAARHAGEPATILLAPACASFDQFPSFAHRGDRFRELVLALEGIKAGSGA